MNIERLYDGVVYTFTAVGAGLGISLFHHLWRYRRGGGE